MTQLAPKVTTVPEAERVGRQVCEEILRRDGAGSIARLHCIFLQLIARLYSIFMEHPDCIKRVFIQPLANQGQFLKEVMSDGDDVAADLVRMENIQQLARTGSDQFLGFMRRHDLHCLLHR